jgi:hypothetical protein
MTSTSATTTTRPPTGTRRGAVGAKPVSTVTRALLACGVIAGPLFVAAVVVQEATRTGFDPREHPLSLLSLGDLGWIQITNFVVAGVLAFASAMGARRVLRPGRAGTWGPILLGVYGVSLVWGGVFVADPAFGFPPGTPDGSPAEMSWHGILHGIAPAVAGVALVAACFVFARRFTGQGRRGWAAYCVATSVADIVLTGASFAASDYRLMLAGGALAWLWASAVSARLLADTR